MALALSVAGSGDVRADGALPSAKRGEAQLRGLASDETGEVSLTEQGERLRLELEVEGLPKGVHQVVLVDDCDEVSGESAETAISAGEAQAAGARPAAPQQERLGSVRVDEGGAGTATVTTTTATLAADEDDTIVGRSIAVMPQTRSREDASKPALVCGAVKTKAGDAPLAAEALLESAPRSRVSGTLRFTQEEDGKVRVRGEVRGLTPGQHGVHIHAVGECRPPAFESAGGHFAGGTEHHGAPTARRHHAGDLGNLQATADGVARIDVRSSDFTLSEGPDSIVGKAFVVHAGPDDMHTQPSGDSGDRVACGVISLQQ